MLTWPSIDLCFSCVGGDFLKVFLHLEASGVSEYTPWSGVLCGDLRDIPQVLYSSRSTLILEFHTQESSSANATGFFGNFHFIDRRKFHHGARVANFQIVVVFQDVGNGRDDRNEKSHSRALSSPAFL